MSSATAWRTDRWKAGSSSGRTGRSRKLPAVGQRQDFLFQLLRIRTDGQPLRCRLVGCADAQAGIQSKHAELVGEQRIDVEFDHLGEVDDQLRDLDQRERDLVDCCRRPMPRSPAASRKSGCGIITSRAKVHVQRRQRQRGVVDDLGRGAAVAEQDHRPELRDLRCTPTISSKASGRSTIGCTVNPSMRAPAVDCELVRASLRRRREPPPAPAGRARRHPHRTCG